MPSRIDYQCPQDCVISYFNKPTIFHLCPRTFITSDCQSNFLLSHTHLSFKEAELTFSLLPHASSSPGPNDPKVYYSNITCKYLQFSKMYLDNYTKHIASGMELEASNAAPWLLDVANEGRRELRISRSDFEDRANSHAPGGSF